MKTNKFIPNAADDVRSSLHSDYTNCIARAVSAVSLLLSTEATQQNTQSSRRAISYNNNSNDSGDRTNEVKRKSGADYLINCIQTAGTPEHCTMAPTDRPTDAALCQRSQRRAELRSSIWSTSLRVCFSSSLATISIFVSFSHSRSLCINIHFASIRMKCAW